jgi:hypothetical protein
MCGLAIAMPLSLRFSVRRAPTIATMVLVFPEPGGLEELAIQQFKS